MVLFIFFYFLTSWFIAHTFLFIKFLIQLDFLIINQCCRWCGFGCNSQLCFEEVHWCSGFFSSQRTISFQKRSWFLFLFYHFFWLIIFKFHSRESHWKYFLVHFLRNLDIKFFKFFLAVLLKFKEKVFHMIWFFKCFMKL